MTTDTKVRQLAEQFLRSSSTTERLKLAARIREISERAVYDSEPKVVPRTLVDYVPKSSSLGHVGGSAVAVPPDFAQVAQESIEGLERELNRTSQSNAMPSPTDIQVADLGTLPRFSSSPRGLGDSVVEEITEEQRKAMRKSRFPSRPGSGE